MIAEKILSGITPEKIKKEVEKIKATKLPPKLEECVKEYEKVGERDRFSWKNEINFWNISSNQVCQSRHVRRSSLKILSSTR